MCTKPSLFIPLLLLVINPLLRGGEDRKIAELMEAYDQHNLFSGTVLVARQGTILFAGAYGTANRDFGTQNNLDTCFNIGSIGKTFTAVSIMQLVEAGQLSLMDPLGKHLTDFPFPEKDTITISNLLEHTSGLGNYMRHEDYWSKMNRLRQVSDFLPLIYSQKPEFAAGERFQYSNSGMVLLGAVIEKVSGKSYPEYLDQHIFKPLGMTRSQLAYREQVVANRAVGYEKSGQDYQGMQLREMPAGPDGGLNTTVNDLLKFDQALYTDRLLNKASRQIMWTRSGPNPDYALGWQVELKNGYQMIGHGGGLPGYNAAFHRFPADKTTVIVLANLGGDAAPVAEQLALLLHGEAYRIPTEMDASYRLGIAHQARRQWQKAISAFEANIVGDKPHLPSLYQLARTRILGGFELSKAIKQLDSYIILADAVSSPSIADAHWRKGVAYQVLNQQKHAEAAFKKALALNPDHRMAKRDLDALKTD